MAIADGTTRGAWICDDAFLEDVESGDDSFVIPVVTDRDFDVEVLVDPYVDAPRAGLADANGTGQEEMLGRFATRLEKLRKKLRKHFDDRDVVVVVGDPAVGDRKGGEPASVWLQAVEELRSPEADPPAILCVPGSAASAWARSCENLTLRAEAAVGAEAADLVTSVYRVCLADGADPHEPHAYVAFLGFPLSDGSTGFEERQLERSERLIRALATGLAARAPLYVVGVRRHGLLDGASAGDGRSSDDFLRHLERCRVSLLVHGASAKPAVVSLTRAPQGGHGSGVSLVACPTFKAGVGVPGLTRVRIDVEKGEAEIVFRYDRGSDRTEPPVQLVRPLVSASRVSTGERRLHGRARRILESPEADAARYAEHVDTMWKDDGYVALTDANGDLPNLKPVRYTSYKLLLLLREVEDGSYQILLSRHTPRSPARVCEWDTLLLPAFTKLRKLLERLRDDVIRQSLERAADPEQAEHTREFDRAIQRLLENEADAKGNVWEDQLHEVASETRVKLSPTEGCVTQYEYQLVTLLPLVEGHDGGDESGTADAARRIVHWLESLETVAVESLERGGAGLRWDPATGLSRGPEARARTRVVPRGAVWFPLQEWRRSPAMLARNADVMSWVEAELQSRMDDVGRLPPELVIRR
jgi:hypothetical protein